MIYHKDKRAQLQDDLNDIISLLWDDPEETVRIMKNILHHLDEDGDMRFLQTTLGDIVSTISHQLAHEHNICPSCYGQLMTVSQLVGDPTLGREFVKEEYYLKCAECAEEY